MTECVRVLVSGAAGQIGYSILQPIACGLAFGPLQPVHIVLFDLPQCEDTMKGVAIELEDLASPCLVGLTVATTPEVAFKDVDFMVCLAGAMAIGEGMTRAMLAKTNKQIYELHGQMLEKYAKKTTKVVVVANPCNTMCLVLSTNAPSIPKKNFTCLTRLDHNRTRARLAYKIGVPTTSIVKGCVWGNHSSSMVPDVTFATATTADGKVSSVKELIKDEKFWSDFTPAVQERAMEVVRLRKRTSALSSAMAAVNHLRDWFCGTPEGDFVSMGVLSDGSYGAPEGVYFGFPCTCKDGEFQIVKDLQLDPAVQEKLKLSGEELLVEKKGLEAL